MEEKNQQDRFRGVDREWGDDPEGRVKVEGASQEYEFSSEESEGEENNREAKHDPPDSRSPEGRVKCEGESRGYEFSSEESEPILLILLLHSYFFETMYFGDKGLAQVSRVAPLEFKASLFPKNVTLSSTLHSNGGHYGGGEKKSNR
jgi:hypothetical protein